MHLSPARQLHFGGFILVSVCAAAVAFAGISVRNVSSASEFAHRTANSAIRPLMPVGSTIVVNSTLDVSSGSDGLCTLHEAITAANINTASGAAAGECGAGSGSDPDTINISVTGTINLSSALPDISSNITINGPGTGSLTVRRNTGGDYRIFNVTFGTVAGIAGLTVANGKSVDGSPGSFGTNAQNGGAILNAGTLTLTDVNLTGSRTGVGGAGLNFGGSGGYGGALANTGTVTMTNCSVTGNVTGNGGFGNAGVGDGGRGGGIYNENNLTMTNCSVNGNTTGDPGTAPGANGKGGEGGGIYSRLGVLTLTNVTVNSNVTGSTPPGNASSSIGGGGGIFTVLGTATLTNCTISGNLTGTGSNGERGYGGGIDNECPMNITGTTISGNTGNSGSAILNRRALTLTNSTISGNHGPSTIISSDSSSSLTLTNTTITANDSVGVIGGGTFTNVRNTIVAGNGPLGGADVDGGPFTSQGNNLIGVNNAFVSGFTNGVNGDQVGTSANPLNARLAALGNYGGPTQTHALLPGSPALDAGDNCVNQAAHCGDANISQLTTDQRGFNRLVNSRVDIGAFESRGFTISATGGTPQSTTIGTTFAAALVATVSSSFGEPVANGVITFAAPNSGASGTFSGGVTTTSVNTNGSGVATAPAFTANLIVGGYNVTAGGSGIASSTSFSLTNTKASSSTSVTSSVNPSSFGQNVTLTATVTAVVGTPTGTVQFKDGATNLGSVNCAAASANTCTAQFSTSTLSVGSHNISADYSGDGNLQTSSGALSITVNCVTTAVSNSNDSGAGSLRYAIAGACPGSTITFDPNMTSGGPVTITLTTGELLVDKNLTIGGLGANVLTIARSSAGGTPNFRIFNVASGVTAAISGLTIINGNVIGVSGGGILNSGTLTLSYCAVTGNRSSVAGGGIANDGGNGAAVMTIAGCLISGNIGNSFGSGIFSSGFHGTATLNITNSTITGNTDVSFGGGIYNDGNAGTATLNLTNTTISGNRAGSSGGGIYNFGNGGTATINLNNTIVSDNIFNSTPNAANGPDIFNFSGSISGNNNLIQTTPGSGYTISGSNNLNGDPLLEKDVVGNLVLKNNGGPTRTLLLLPNSSAINAGSNTAANSAGLSTDQRGSGFPRIINANADIGALEANYSITASSGSGQSTIINSAFANQLQATVQESGINQNGVSVTFTAPASGASGTFPGNVTTAIATTNSLGVATASTFTANGIAGSYNVTASLVGGTPSCLFGLTNTKNPTTTGVASALNPAEFGQSVTFTATVTSSGGTPTGTVQFKDGGTNLGSPVALNGSGIAQLTTSSLTTGTHTITADYGGDANFLNSTGTLSGGQVVNAQFQLLLDSSGPAANQAAAFDSLLLVRDPFHAQSIANWFELGADRNTRVLIFAANLQLNQGETASAVVINLIDANSVSYNLVAEDVRIVPNSSFVQIRFRLPDGLAPGTCQVAIKAHSQTSNAASFRITP